MDFACPRGFRLPAFLRSGTICSLGVVVLGFGPVGPLSVHTHRQTVRRHHRHALRRHHRRSRRHHRRLHHRGHRAQAACQDASRPASALSLDQARVTVICLINRERTDRGLPTLSESAKLDRSAQNWTDHMVATGDFSHGISFSARIAAAGYDWQTAGENIAAGQLTPRGVVDAWMASTGHCQNILTPEFKDVGAGMSTTPVPAWGTAPVTWTVDFGLAAGESAPSHNTGPQQGCPYH